VTGHVRCLIVELDSGNKLQHITFEVFTAVTKEDAVFSDLTPCGSCKNRSFGGT
jgi:hypothetical protein